MDFTGFTVGRGLAPAVYHLRRIVDIYGFLGRERRPRRSEINNYSFIRTLPILSPTGSSFAKGAHAIGYCFVGLLRKGGGTA